VKCKKLTGGDQRRIRKRGEKGKGIGWKRVRRAKRIRTRLGKEFQRRENRSE